jgi:hypothetical protein
MCFSGNPVWLSDPNGDSTPVKMNIIDKDGQPVNKPTVMSISCDVAKNVQGMRCVGYNRVEVTPGTYTYPDGFVPNNVSPVNTFMQEPGDANGGILYTWNPGSPPSSPTQPPPPPIVAAAPTLQFNNQITGVQNVMGPVGNFNRILTIGFNPASGTADAARFGNPSAGIAQMNGLVNQLRRRGITNGVNITVGTDFVSTTSPSNQYGTSGGLLAARGRYIQSFFRGIRTNLTPPATGTTAQITVTVNANAIGLIGWNVTTQAMQRQTINGNVVPGSTQPTPGSAPAINFQRNAGGAAPRVGKFTGRWR